MIKLKKTSMPQGNFVQSIVEEIYSGCAYNYFSINDVKAFLFWFNNDYHMGYWESSIDFAIWYCYTMKGYLLIDMVALWFLTFKILSFLGIISWKVWTILETYFFFFLFLIVFSHLHNQYHKRSPPLVIYIWYPLIHTKSHFW